MDYFHSSQKPTETLNLNLIEVVKSSTGRISVPIKKTICVFKESTSTVILKYKNKEITRFTTFNDYYGDSIDSAIKEALDIEKSYQIDPKSGLSLVIETTFIKRFAVPHSEKNKYMYVPQNWFLDSKDTKKLIELFEKYNQDESDYDNIMKLRLKVDFETKTELVAETWNSLTKVKSKLNP